VLGVLAALATTGAHRRHHLAGPGAASCRHAGATPQAAAPALSDLGGGTHGARAERGGMPRATPDPARMTGTAEMPTTTRR
jgi:hypothetical protein